MGSKTVERDPRVEKAVDAEMKRRYGYFRGENPDRAKIRLILDEEPMAMWLARDKIRTELTATAEVISRGPE